MNEGRGTFLCFEFFDNEVHGDLYVCLLIYNIYMVLKILTKYNIKSFYNDFILSFWSLRISCWVVKYIYLEMKIRPLENHSKITEI